MALDPSEATTVEQPGTWADLLTVIAACLREPDEDLVTAVRDGSLQRTLAATVEPLDLEEAGSVEPPTIPSLGAATEAYRELFEGLATPYAPNAESPYKPWYGDRTGLMSGPPADEMARRYEAVDATAPTGYPPDHVALLLEYGALVLEAGDVEGFRRFQAAHFDWFPALRLATAGAEATAPFHRWAVHLLADVTGTLRDRLDVDDVPDERAVRMVAGIPETVVRSSRADSRASSTRSATGSSP